MPSSRKHATYCPCDAASAGDTCTSTRGESAADAPRAEAGDFIDQTIAIWQKRTERKLTGEDGREIIENISGFFSILQEWEQRERAAESARMALSSHSKRAGRSEVEAEISISSTPVRAENQA